MNHVKEFVYRHLVLEGTAYEIGRQQGEFLKRYHPSEVDFFKNGNEFIRPAAMEQIKKTIVLFDKYCPNINEEIRGFADSIGMTPQQVIYYSFSYEGKGNCGHFAVLPKCTADGHLYVGRSYEWSTEDDLRLITVRSKGFNASMGFSLLFFGRYDGINEHGLCVTMSNGVPCEMSEEEGFRFWVVIRILLDQCSTVNDAMKLLEELPISSYCNLIIADRLNNAVLVEISNGTRAYKRIAEAGESSYVGSTNHYTLPEMQDCVRNRMRQSMDRYDAITKTLDNKNGIQRDALMGLLSKHMPEGLACHYYEDGLGTLWSILFDVTTAEAEICFGSPVQNKWRTFRLGDAPGVTEYKASLPFEEADPAVWQKG